VLGKATAISQVIVPPTGFLRDPRETLKLGLY
jgi:hypothetical protein